MRKIFLLFVLYFSWTNVDAQTPSGNVMANYKGSDPGAGTPVVTAMELPLGDGYYRIKSVCTNRYLNVATLSSYLTQTVATTLNESQIFYFKKVMSSGIPAYQITLYSNPSKFLLTATCETGQRARVAVGADCPPNFLTSMDRLFVLYPPGGDARSAFGFRIRPQCSTEFLDIANAVADEGVEITSALRNNTFCEDFFIEKVADLTSISTPTSGSQKYTPKTLDKQNTLVAGDKLTRGQYIVSANGAFCLLLTKGGILNVYRGNNPNLLRENEAPLTTVPTIFNVKIDEFSIASTNQANTAKRGVYIKVGTVQSALTAKTDAINCFLLLTDEGQVQILPGESWLYRMEGAAIETWGNAEKVTSMRLVTLDLISSVVTSEGENRMKANSVTVCNSTDIPQQSTVEFTVVEGSNTTFETNNSWVLEEAITATATVTATASAGAAVGPFEASAEVTTSLQAVYGHTNTKSGGTSNSTSNSYEESRTISVPVSVSPGKSVNVIIQPNMQKINQQYYYTAMVVYGNGAQKYLNGILTVEKVYPNSYSTKFTIVTGCPVGQ
jgi:hypothetical protein